MFGSYTIIIVISLKQAFPTLTHDQKKKITRDHSAWTIGNGDPMHGMCIPTRYISRMGAARVKKEEETDTRILREYSMKSGRKERGNEEECPKQDLTNAKDLIVEPPEGRKSPYHRLY